MRPGGGKAKGGSFERQIAEVLTKAYYPDGDGIFQRILPQPIPKKGEVRGDLKALRYMSDGTISIPPRGPNADRYLVFDSTWPFVVECKNYKDVDPFFKGLYAKDTLLFDWIDQANEVALLEHKMPLVVFRLFRTENIAMMWNRDYIELVKMFGVMPTRTFLLSRDKVMEHTALRFVLLNDFLEWVDWGVYKAARGSSPTYIRSILPKGDEK